MKYQHCECWLHEYFLINARWMGLCIFPNLWYRLSIVFCLLEIDIKEYPFTVQFLNHDIINILNLACCRKLCDVHCRIFKSIHDLYLSDASSSIPSHLWQTKCIQRFPWDWGDKMTHGSKTTPIMWSQGTNTGHAVLVSFQIQRLNKQVEVLDNLLALKAL